MIKFLLKWLRIFICSMIGHKQGLVEYQFYIDKMDRRFPYDMVLLSCGICHRKLRWVDPNKNGIVYLGNRKNV